MTRNRHNHFRKVESRRAQLAFSQHESLRHSRGACPRESGERESTKGPTMTKQPAVYILASRRNGTLCTGVTGDLVRRVWEHRSGLIEGFTKRYQVHHLVYFEVHDHVNEAIQREKRIKNWNRAWKIALIEESNPEWHDLWPTIIGDEDVDSRSPLSRGQAPRE